jgi:hypothetical protein
VTSRKTQFQKFVTNNSSVKCTLGLFWPKNGEVKWREGKWGKLTTPFRSTRTRSAVPIMSLSYLHTSYTDTMSPDLQYTREGHHLCEPEKRSAQNTRQQEDDYSERDVSLQSYNCDFHVPGCILAHSLHNAKELLRKSFSDFRSKWKARSLWMRVMVFSSYTQAVRQGLKFECKRILNWCTYQPWCMLRPRLVICLPTKRGHKVVVTCCLWQWCGAIPS